MIVSFLWSRQDACLYQRQGQLLAIALGLELKFGTEDLQLMPEIEQIEDVATLEAIVQGIKTLNTLDELR